MLQRTPQSRRDKIVPTHTEKALFCHSFVECLNFGFKSNLDSATRMESDTIMFGIPVNKYVVFDN